MGYVGHVRRMDASPPQGGVWGEEETRLAEGLLVAFPRPADCLPPKMYGSGQAEDSGGRQVRVIFYVSCPSGPVRRENA